MNILLFLEILIYLKMIRNFKNCLNLVLTGGIGFSIYKHDKIIDFTANYLENYSSRYVCPVQNERLKDDKELNKLLSIVILI